MVAALVGLEIGGTLVTHRNSLVGGSAGSVARGQGGLPAAQAQAVAAVVDRSVVDVNARLGYEEAAAAGTGMVLSAAGEVLTNNHVIAGETSLSVTVVGGKTYGAKVLGTDPTADVALLQLTGASGLTPITTDDPAKLSSGQPIVAVGNAGGVGGTPSVVTGTVAALGQSVTASDLGGGNEEQLSDMIEMNAPLEPGDSGGPLIDASSHVVGMDTAAAADPRFQNQSNLGFAIPITRAVAIAQQIAAGHASSTVLIGVPGFLGVSVSDGSSPPGASIDGVLPGSPADKGGMTPGDVITAIDGKAVGSSSGLTVILQQHHAGEKVTVGWIDTLGATHTTAMTLIVGPAA
jgi:S1-C subfamily serine protease